MEIIWKSLSYYRSYWGIPGPVGLHGTCAETTKTRGDLRRSVVDRKSYRDEGDVIANKIWANDVMVKTPNMWQGRSTPIIFHIIGDGHQPNHRGLYANYKDSLFKVGWVYPKYRDWIDHGTVKFPKSPPLKGKGETLPLIQNTRCFMYGIFPYIWLKFIGSM